MQRLSLFFLAIITLGLSHAGRFSTTDGVDFALCEAVELLPNYTIQLEDIDVQKKRAMDEFNASEAGRCIQIYTGFIEAIKAIQVIPEPEDVVAARRVLADLRQGYIEVRHKVEMKRSRLLKNLERLLEIDFSAEKIGC